jgi:hypothetical protein
VEVILHSFLTSTLDTRHLVGLTLRPLSPRDKSLRYLLNRRLRGYQNLRPEKFLAPAENGKMISKTSNRLAIHCTDWAAHLQFVFWAGGWGGGAISPVRLRRASCMLLQWTRYPDRSSFEQLSEMSGRRLQSCNNRRFVGGTGQRAMMASHGRNCGLSTETPPGRMHHACNWSYL